MLLFLSNAWAIDICGEFLGSQISTLTQALKTIYPNVTDRNLHYLHKHYVYGHKSCRADEVWVQGPLFSEDGFDSEGNETTVQGEKAEKLNNSFCMSKSQFEYERSLARGIFQTRVSSGSLNEGTSFLISKNIIMTNHHIAAPGSDGKDCKKLEIVLNKDNSDWIKCKKVLFCDEAKDVCFVEMNQASPGVEIGDLVPRMKLNCARTIAQKGMLIGNSYKFGIQGSAGTIGTEFNGTIKHHLPMVGGASGSPILSNNGEVIGINYGHNGKPGEVKDFVSMNEKTDYNTATSMYWIRNQIATQLKNTMYGLSFSQTGPSRLDLEKIDNALKQNPSCGSWQF